MKAGAKPDKRRNGVKPPWISRADLDAFFERSQRLGGPKRLDSAWVSNYKLASANPDTVVGLLKWLGVVGADGLVNAANWDSLRVPATRKSYLKSLIEESFSGIFDAVEVPTATDEDLAGAFIEEYSVGDTTRQVRAFVALCEHAGIRGPRPTKAARVVSGRAADKAEKAQNDMPKPPARTRHKETTERGYSIAVKVEIPADWDENQVRDRLAMVKKNLESVETDG